MLIWKGCDMLKFCRLFLSSIICLSLVQFSVPRLAHSEDQGNEGKAIKALAVKNNRAISAETILSKIKTKVQDPYSQVVKDLLEEDGKIIGYLTGYSIYNQLGLTTQVSNTIQIGKNEIRPGFKRERYTIAFIKQKNTLTKENIPLLQILDAIRYIKKIPDATIESSCRRLSVILKIWQRRIK